MPSSQSLDVQSLDAPDNVEQAVLKKRENHTFI